MAPLSNAERQKRYRERLKQNNPEKFEEKRKAHLEKVKQNKKKQSERNENEKKKQREQWRKYSAKYYSKQKKVISNESTKDANANIKNMQKKFRKKTRKLQNEISEAMEIAKIHIKENRRLRKQILRLQKKLVTVSQNNLKTGLVDEHCCLLIDSCNHKSQPHQLSNSTIDALTPKKKTELFIESLSSVNHEDKNKLKKKLLELNVLSESLKQSYRKSTKREKRTFKKVVMNPITLKYKLVTHLSKMCIGLVGKIRKSGKIINRRRNKQIEEIHNFYNRDDISRATAGKKETKTKHKEKVQRRYLFDTIKNLHKKYKDNGGKASYSSFLRHKPFYVLTPKLNDCDTCACIKHANFQFKISKLFAIGIIKTNNISDIMRELSCDLNSKACMYNECSACSTKLFNIEDNQDSAAKITWKQWCLKKVPYQKKNEEGNLIDHETKKFRREEIETTLHELLSKFQEEAMSFKKHFFNNNHQQKVFRESKENIKDDEAVIICDFSENYQGRHHVEIQGTHFNASRNQITLHTGVIYINNQKPISFCTLSPNTEHNPYSIWAHLSPVINFLKAAYPKIKKIHFFSDGPSTQYKQKLNFILFAKIMKHRGFKNCTWNFFESAHGKNAADGIGGAVKRTLDSCVAFGLDIPDAVTAFRVLREKSKIMIYFVKDTDIQAMKEYLGDEKIIPLRGTMAVHQIVTTENENQIKYRDISCLCGENRGQCTCFNIKKHFLTDSAASTSEVSSMKKKELAKNKVVLLSDVILTEENSKFIKTLPLCLRQIDTNTDLFCEESTLKRCRNNLSTGKHINVKINYHGHLSGNEDKDEQTLKPEVQKGRKKRLTKRAAKGNKRPTKKRKLSNASTTSESGNISIYSDSDIENFEDVTDSSLDTICVDETSKSIAKKEFSVHIKKKSQQTDTPGNITRYYDKKQELQTKNKEKIRNYIIEDKVSEETFTKTNSIAYNTQILNENRDLLKDIEMENIIQEEILEENYSKETSNNLIEKDNTQGLDKNKEIQMETNIQEEILKERIPEKNYKTSNNLIEKNNTQGLDKNNEIKEIEMKTNIQEEILKERILEKNYSKKTANDLVDEDNLLELHKDEGSPNEIYTVGDTVLVRYYSRKMWKYYAGVIENIDISVDKLYTVSFFKTINNNKGNLKFRKQHRLDVDKVSPETLIVKKIELLQITENPYELVLFNDDDLIYFT